MIPISEISAAVSDTKMAFNPKLSSQMAEKGQDSEGNVEDPLVGWGLKIQRPGRLEIMFCECDYNWFSGLPKRQEQE